MKTHVLFVYGTIADEEIFKLLLGRPPVYQKASLRNYALFAHPENGYLFVKPELGNELTGKLVSITDDELKVLDLWEDVPLYQREVLEVETNDGIQTAFVYTQNETIGISPNSFTLNKREDVLKEIRQFRKWVKNNLNE